MTLELKIKLHSITIPKFWKGGGSGKKWVPGVPAMDICLGEGTCYVSCQKKDFEIKIWPCGLNFKCWSWPVLAKQPINI